MQQELTENNMGETNKTSVKVHHAPGGQSNFSLGWDDNSYNQPQRNLLSQKF